MGAKQSTHDVSVARARARHARVVAVGPRLADVASHAVGIEAHRAVGRMDAGAVAHDLAVRTEAAVGEGGAGGHVSLVVVACADHRAGAGAVRGASWTSDRAERVAAPVDAQVVAQAAAGGKRREGVAWRGAVAEVGGACAEVHELVGRAGGELVGHELSAQLHVVERRLLEADVRARASADAERVDHVIADDADLRVDE